MYLQEDEESKGGDLLVLTDDADEDIIRDGEDKDDATQQFKKMIKLATFQANRNAVEAGKGITIRDGLSGMIIGRVANYIDMEVIKQLHLDRGIIQKIHTLDQNTASIIDTEEAFDRASSKEGEASIILFAFDKNY